MSQSATAMAGDHSLPGYSVAILTLNEERDLPRCLASVACCDDVVVLDSGSTDRTVEIARAAGARVFVRTFDTFAGQRNYAHRQIPFRHTWVFHLDADEQMTPELDCEIRRALASAEKLDGFFVAPKMIWAGHWIRHCTDFPAWQARLARIPQFDFIDVGHGQREALHLRMGRLNANYLHNLSSGGDREWLDRHRRYARAEARQHLASESDLRLRDLFSTVPLLRRRALKRLSYRLPARPLLRFIYQYVFRGGFLDGSAGLHYSRFLAGDECFTTAELRRLRATGR